MKPFAQVPIFFQKLKTETENRLTEAFETETRILKNRDGFLITGLLSIHFQNSTYLAESGLGTCTQAKIT